MYSHLYNSLINVTLMVEILQEVSFSSFLRVDINELHQSYFMKKKDMKIKDIHFFSQILFLFNSLRPNDAYMCR